MILGLRLDTGVPLAATPTSRRSPTTFGWALAAELLDVTDDDRVVLTTRGRLLSNELFRSVDLRAIASGVDALTLAIRGLLRCRRRC